MRIGEGSPRLPPLRDLSVDLAAKAAAFRSSLPPEIQTALAHLVRAMNCYYSNLIEGHDTHPVDIERALNNDFSDNPEQRDLQLEARAHIAVQEWIDAGGLAGRAQTVEGLRETHARFCEHLPESLLWAEMPGGERLRVEPGALRTRDVQVGRHVAISPGAVPRFLEHFEWAYRRLGRSDAIIAVAAAHHRFVWIHPFLDGNGRVARLMSHAMLLETLDTGGVWSVARGLGRTAQDYKRHLAACDLPRRNDLDGRGALSEEELASFTGYFLQICIDQVDFMQGLVDPNRLRTRIHRWIEEEAALGNLPLKAGAIIDAILYRGELPRSELDAVVGTGDRQARRIASSLLDLGVVVSESSRAPLRMAFPAALASRWMPGLFPEKA
ncbi:MULTISPECIES: Fic family protein [unclassified Sphingopyxis]|nr:MULTISPECIES: Fic family protein [unclassified Sphingopyxis]